MASAHTFLQKIIHQCSAHEHITASHLIPPHACPPCNMTTIVILNQYNWVLGDRECKKPLSHSTTQPIQHLHMKHIVTQWVASYSKAGMGQWEVLDRTIFRVCGQLYPRKKTSHTQETLNQEKTVREEKPRKASTFIRVPLLRAVQVDLWLIVLPWHVKLQLCVWLTAWRQLLYNLGHIGINLHDWRKTFSALRVEVTERTTPTQGIHLKYPGLPMHAHINKQSTYNNTLDTRHARTHRNDERIFFF